MGQEQSNLLSKIQLSNYICKIMKSQHNQYNRNYLIKHLQLIKNKSSMIQLIPFLRLMILYSIMHLLKEIKNQYNIYYQKEHHPTVKIQQRNLTPGDVTDDQEIKLLLQSK